MQSAFTGVANNVTSVAGIGLRLALLLNAVACQVASLGVDIHSISKGIALFSTSLKQLGQSFQAEHTVHTRECAEKAHQISDQARIIFAEVEDMLDRVQKAEVEPDQQDVSVQQRFKSFFKKQRVTYLLAHLESLKLSLMVMLQVLHLGRLQEVKSVLNNVTDELIVQERADAQNMLIVRYWSVKRLDRLWDLARQEASDTTTSLSPETTISDSLMPPKQPVIFLGVETSLNSIEQSPSEMLRLTEEVLDALLKRWIRVEAGQHFNTMPLASVDSESDNEVSDIPDREVTQGYFIEGVTTDWRKPNSQEARMKAAQLRRLYSSKQAHVHSDSEDSVDSATKKKRTETSPRENRPFTSSEFDDMPEQGQFNTKGDDVKSQQRDATSRPYSYSTRNAVPECDAQSHWRHEGPRNHRSQSRPQSRPQPDYVPPIQTHFPPPQSRPILVPQTNVNRDHPGRLSSSQPARPPLSPSNRNDMGIPASSSSSHYMPMATNGFPTTTTYFSQPPPQARYAPPPSQQQQQQKLPPPQFRQQTNPTYVFSRSVSDTSIKPQPQPHPPLPSQSQYLTTPTTPSSSQPHRHRSSRNNHSRSRSRSRNRSRSQSHSQSPSPARNHRHKDLKRTALRGVLGVSAIGGFMDALEAFSII